MFLTKKGDKIATIYYIQIMCGRKKDILESVETLETH